MSKVLVLMGSSADLGHAVKIRKTLEIFDVEVQIRIASAHKIPLKALEIIRDNENEVGVFITIAGRSNALSGFSDAQTFRPVIACPPPSEAFGGADIWSSLRMPSGVAPLTILDPENAGVAAVKILSLADPSLAKKIARYQEEKRNELERADREVKNG